MLQRITLSLVAGFFQEKYSLSFDSGTMASVKSVRIQVYVIKDHTDITEKIHVKIKQIKFTLLGDLLYKSTTRIKNNVNLTGLFQRFTTFNKMEFL